MKKIQTIAQLIGIILLFILIGACNGGDDGGGTTTGGTNGMEVTPGGSADMTVSSLASGVIEGFGSIIVNGIEFETEGAAVDIENEAVFDCSPSGTDDCGLRIGMVVTLENAFDDSGNPATVTRIRYEDTLEGPISAFAETTPGLVKTVAVMGQSVILQKGVTRFDDSDAGFDAFDDVGPGNVNNLVEVSGFIDVDGSIRATYIERKALAPIAGDQFEVKGTVTGLATAANTFQINGLTIDYSGVVPRNGTLANGRPVEVKGGNLVGTTLQATEVEINAGGLNIDNAAKVHLEGFVTSLDAAAHFFTVDGQGVAYSGALFVGGSQTDLADGVKVEAEGPVLEGVLQAVKVTFKDIIRFKANVNAIDAVAGTLTLEGLIGITVQIDDLTVLDGFGGLDDLGAGNHLEIRGRRMTPIGRVVIAGAVALIDALPDDRTTIQGPVDDFVPFASVDILGVTVDTTTIQDDDFKDGDTVIGENEFFNRLASGLLVKARLDLETGAWDQIEFEDD